jgi:hypothetical protein
MGDCYDSIVKPSVHFQAIQAARLRLEQIPTQRVERTATEPSDGPAAIKVHKQPVAKTKPKKKAKAKVPVKKPVKSSAEIYDFLL